VTLDEQLRAEAVPAPPTPYLGRPRPPTFAEYGPPQTWEQWMAARSPVDRPAEPVDEEGP
jgi:hypothetical protein